MDIRSKNFWRWFGILVIGLSAWYWYVQRTALQAFAAQPGTPVVTTNFPSTSVALASFVLAVVLLIITFVFKPGSERAKQEWLPRMVAWGLALALLLGSIVYLFLTTKTVMWGVSGRMVLFVWICGIGAWLLNKSRDPIQPAQGFILLLLIAGCLYRVGLFVPEMQSTPFSMGWSEGSRYYNASLYFAQNLYGSDFPLPVLHPSRYIMQAAAFLFAPQNIFVHRIWQVFLWLSMTFLGAYSVARRFSLKNRPVTFAMILWLFLFFFQGAVYYHLMVCVVLVMLGYRRDSFWRTLIFVVLASVWAGLSRVNWYPVPALLAVSIYLLEERVEERGWLNYLIKPAAWSILGSTTAFFSNRIYAVFSGNDVTQFSSSFTSYMIWSRLLPNPTFPMGVIPATLLVSLPLMIISWVYIRHHGGKYYWHWVRTLGLAAILAMFALGGIVVSVKIGGGGDLHNLDAYLVFLAVIGLSLVFNRFTAQKPSIEREFHMPLYWMIPVILVPLFFTLQSGVSWTRKDVELASADIQLIQEVLDLTSEELPGPVLFISERQLLTFGEIQGTVLVPDYEKVFLMEMVMANNEPYLSYFHEKLKQQEFSVIVVDSLSELYKKPEDSFWVENNKWLDKVVLPILQTYEPVYMLQDRGVNLLIPRGHLDLYTQLLKLSE